ncbi:rhodanese-like domain-containing protein [Neobacillus sp. LXY-4]|uniref:rhodanese-like domain-containing protein n=1 Tax=Neobacillus sp. LXY-4 TaxID=3379826 RepID=UPI003EE29B44
MKRLTILFIAILLLSGCAPGENKAETSDKGNVKISSGGEYKPKTDAEEKEKSTADADFKTINSEEAKKMIASSEVQIIDVRSPELYAEAHLPNAQNIPLKDLEAKQAELDKETTYLIICKTGKTSEEASKLLAQNGFKNIYNISGGMESWE